MSRSESFSLTRFSLSSVFWYGTVALGWPLILIAVVAMLRSPSVEFAPAFAMTAALGIILELLPLVQGRGHDPQGVVMSTAFVFAMLFIWGAAPAIAMVALGAFVSDVRAGKSWWKVAFNPAQYAICLGAASLTCSLAVSRMTLSMPLEAFHFSDLGWMAVAWVVYFVVNLVLVAGVLALNNDFWPLVFEDFWHNAMMTFAVLALSPLVVLVGVGTWGLMPLLLIPLLLLYYTAQLALEREHDAGHDALTGLPNRTTLQFELESAFAAYERESVPFALMLIDLNDFKRVNDTLGHQVGDTLLVQFADRLNASIRPDDSVARLGGDEFAVLVRDIDGSAALEAANRILAAVASAFVVDALSLEINLSLGIALCPDHGLDATTLLRRADVGMYTAKRRDTGIEIYSPEYDDNSAETLGLLGELRNAIAEDEIELHYQPKLALNTLEVLGVEALVRWRHPGRGLIPPDEFIPLAERSGVMPLLTRRVLELAISQAAQWKRDGIEVNVAVNISLTDLVSDQIVGVIHGALEAHDVDPSQLLLEITERLATQRVEEVTFVLDRLRANGIRISLDDFGTGYSSVSRLSSLPVDEIKIDRSFTKAITQSRSGLGIVRALIDLGHALDLPVIAEGVETMEEWQALRALDCDGIQGWSVSRPLPAEEVTAWMLERLGVTTLPSQAPRRRIESGQPHGTIAPTALQI